MMQVSIILLYYINVREKRENIKEKLILPFAINYTQKLWITVNLNYETFLYRKMNGT